MALSVKHLNSDASFLLSFEPILPEFAQGTVTLRPFTILLDPWITGPSKIFHSKISISTHIHPACISSLSDLPSPPDLVIISQHKSDHCNEATLRQLPASGGKTLILAEPTAARLIKSWKYFDQEKIRTIDRWEDPRSTGKESVLRIPVPPVTLGGQGGEVTVAFIPQKRDLTCLHAAIGITYRPPPTHNLKITTPVISKPLSPPATPSSQNTQASNATSTNTLAVPDAFLLPPTPPVSPHSLRSVQSASTLLPSPTRPTLDGHFPRSASQTYMRPATSNGTIRPISILFSPHGISYEHLAPYVTSHLVAEAALPLTALLHCMDSISNPWWLGGNICAGVPTGAEIATRLGARVWISAHDGEKDVRGLATGMLKTRRWKREEVEEALGPRIEMSKPGEGKLGHRRNASSGSGNGGVTTEVLRLGSGGEVIVNGNGLLWYSLENREDQWAVGDAKPPTKVKVKDLDKAKLAVPHTEKAPGGLKTRKSTRGGLSVRFRSTLVT
ncbi:hypothetical protein F4820DRAFT_115999 [Hypoxylon rubiginosum]|uniref:Uncharacterized protein n=1 Tax=Hypoxylon rubiginosum TaxID=110542 RepID=A0ACB9ZAN8_9PEZI|nr:hypothetical protein F4820DRAFT_115999 [Hypoxylon rubiginosum]